jgi:competence protein ComEC
VVILWQGRLRWAGLLPLLAAFALWPGGGRPNLLIAPSGGVMAILGPEGRAVSRPKGDGFVVDSWLENDGEIATQTEAAARPGFAGSEREVRAEVGGHDVLLLRGKRALAGVEGCSGAAILVTNEEDGGERPCLVLDARLLRRSGSVAVWEEKGVLRLVGAEEVAGDRPWTRPGRDNAPASLPSLP